MNTGEMADYAGPIVIGIFTNYSLQNGTLTPAEAQRGLDKIAKAQDELVRIGEKLWPIAHRDDPPPAPNPYLGEPK